MPIVSVGLVFGVRGCLLPGDLEPGDDVADGSGAGAEDVMAGLVPSPRWKFHRTTRWSNMKQSAPGSIRSAALVRGSRRMSPRPGYLVLWLGRVAARDRAPVRWRTEPGPDAARLSTTRAALDTRAGWRDGQRCKLAQLAYAGGNHGASLHRDRPGYYGGPLPSGFRRGGNW
jgi:hypothetical protein